MLLTPHYTAIGIVEVALERVEVVAARSAADALAASAGSVASGAPGRRETPARTRWRAKPRGVRGACAMIWGWVLGIMRI